MVVQYTVEQFRRHVVIANRFIEAAEALLRLGYNESAVSRAYYAVFTAMVALVAVKAGLYRKRWDHIQLHKMFLEKFTKVGFLFTKNDADDYTELLERRLDVDYHLHQLQEEKARQLVNKARDLVEKVIGRLQANA